MRPHPLPQSQKPNLAPSPGVENLRTQKNRRRASHHPTQLGASGGPLARGRMGPRRLTGRFRHGMVRGELLADPVPGVLFRNHGPPLAEVVLHLQVVDRTGRVQ